MHRLEHSRRKRIAQKHTLSAITLLLACLFLLAGCSLPGGSSATTSVSDNAIPTPTPGPTQPVTLTTIHMINPMTGWAVTSNNHVLYTTSGTQHWQDVTPSAAGQSFTVGASYFLDAQNAWITLQFKSTTSVFHTYNSGALWYETPIVDTGVTVTHIQFSDAQTGWLVYCKAVNASTHSEQVDIFNTSDGGTDWYLLSSSTTNATTQNGIADDGVKSGLSFNSTSNGWLTATSPTNTQFLLYTTSDGATTWHTQSLTLPTSTGRNVLAAASPPQFFSANAAVLPLTFSTASSTTYVFYQTNDGGKTWLQYATNSQISSNVTFYDANHAWATGGNSKRVIYATGDGGKTWKQQGSLPSTVTSVAQIDFVSATTGWAIGTTNNRTTLLFQTGDAGKTWSNVPTVSSAL